MVDLDHEKSGAHFESWRLSQPLPKPEILALPHPVKVLAQPGSGYLQVRAAVQHNHLQECDGSLFSFLGSDSQPSLYQLSDPCSRLQSAPPLRLSQSGPAPGSCERQQQLTCSIVNIVTPEGPRLSWLASDGHGSLQLLQDVPASGMQSCLDRRPAGGFPCFGTQSELSPSATGTSGNCVHSLLNAAAEVARPFVILSACQADAGQTDYPSFSGPLAQLSISTAAAVASAAAALTHGGMFIQCIPRL